MSKFFQRRDLDKTFFKVLVSMLMVFVLLISVASPSHAVVGVTSILIPSVIAALESWGISTAADGLDGAAIAEWFHDKLTSWETAAQISLANIVTGIKMTPIGQVLLNPIALAGIREFAAWLVQQEGLVAGGNEVPVISATPTMKLTPDVLTSCLVLNNGTSYQVKSSSDHAYVYFTLENGLYYLYGASLSSEMNGSSVTIYVYKNSARTGSITVSSGAGAVRHALFSSSFASSNVAAVYFPVYANSDGGDQALLNPPSSDGTMSLVPSAEMEVPTSSDIQDKEMLINTSLDVGADAAAWYEQVMNKVAANDMTATGTLVGVGTITADQVIDQGAITEQEGVVSWPDVTVPIGVSGLDEIFPFCIPFDIYHFFEALAADPVAPSFEIPFVIEGVVDYTFEIDLEPFDQAAQILRLVELLAFCVGLAFVTRSMFIRG